MYFMLSSGFHPYQLKLGLVEVFGPVLMTLKAEGMFNVQIPGKTEQGFWQLDLS